MLKNESEKKIVEIEKRAQMKVLTKKSKGLLKNMKNFVD